MTHGAPDYSNVGTGDAIFRVDDMSELAVRLGAPNVYDRRGNTLWFEEFNNGIAHLDDYTVGTGSKQELVITPVFRPPYAARLVAGSSADCASGFTKRFSLVKSNRVGVSVLFFPEMGSETFDIEIYRRYTTYQYRARMRVDNQLHILYVGNADGGYTIIDSNLPNFFLAGGYVPFKMVVDLDKNYYIRAILGDIEYNVSDYAMRKITASYSPGWEINVLHRNTTGVAQGLHIDNIVVTVNEP